MKLTDKLNTIVSDIYWMALRQVEARKEARDILPYVTMWLDLNPRQEIRTDKVLLENKELWEYWYHFYNYSPNPECTLHQQTKIKRYQTIIEYLIPLAIRYAHGRMTYAPSIVRMAVEEYKKIKPSYVVPLDERVKPPVTLPDSIHFKSDFLHDLLG
jgi:hypothetical protein